MTRRASTGLLVDAVEVAGTATLTPCRWARSPPAVAWGRAGADRSNAGACPAIPGPAGARDEPGPASGPEPEQFMPASGAATSFDDPTQHAWARRGAGGAGRRSTRLVTPAGGPRHRRVGTDGRRHRRAGPEAHRRSRRPPGWRWSGPWPRAVARSEGDAPSVAGRPDPCRPRWQVPVRRRGQGPASGVWVGGCPSPADDPMVRTGCGGRRGRPNG